MNIKEIIYQKSPVCLQNLFCTMYGYIESKKRFNDQFRFFLSDLICKEWLGKNQIEYYKKQKITNLIFWSVKTPFYSKFITKDLSKIVTNPYDVLSEMPILTKETVVNNYASLHNKTTTQNYLIKTSGTTGKALRMIKTYNDTAMQWGVWFRHRHRFGVSYKDLSVNFTGKLVVPSKQVKPPFWRYNKAQNQYLINMQHINGKNIGCIVEFLNTISPVFYSGYPSIISEVSRLANSFGLALNESSKPRVIFCGAENTLDYQKDEMSIFTGAIITDQYGLTEGNCNLSKCLHGYYHEDFEFCHVELIDEVTLPDGRKRGRLVGTGFYNEAFPLLRYDTGDIAIAMPDDFKCPCGRHSKVFHSIEGRVDDYVLTVDGRKVMRFDYLFKDTGDIEEAQVVQNELKKIAIRIKLRSGENIGSLEKILRQRVKDIICPQLLVDFYYVDQIEKSSTGKFKAVVNNIEH
ncbi:hypothetical protein [Endozoicomonas sp. ISHI1]|uniref:hypothetical protein n=1 Tax=Endozoicomonas sp. ISHI1 TaxID=2825882 RepID=UPI002148B2B0|nr:hypothetical protein [Endozoicomonas sp. ISHI1]